MSGLILFVLDVTNSNPSHFLLLTTFVGIIALASIYISFKKEEPKPQEEPTPPPAERKYPHFGKAISWSDLNEDEEGDGRLTSGYV